MAKESKSNGQSAKAQTKIVTSPTEPFSAMEEIQGRAPVGGKVAMIERGAKEAKVIDMSKKSASTKPKNKKPTKRAPKTKAKKAASVAGAASSFPLSQDGIEDVREAQAEIDNIHLEMGRNLALFFSTVQQLDEHAGKAQESFRSTIARLRKKSGAPEGYVLNLAQMEFIPNPNAQQQQQMPMQPPPANN